MEIHTTFRERMRRFYRGSGAEQKETHYLLDGGKLLVPHQDSATFLEMYMQHLQEGGRAFVIERRSDPVFAMFFDIDAHLTEEPTDEWVRSIAKYTLSCVHELYVHRGELSLVMCVTDTKTVRKNNSMCVKCGLHMHIPELHVTREQAEDIRTAVVQKLSNNMGERPAADGPTTWKEDVDAAVYRANGLRALYSRKLVTCPACRGRNKEECVDCLGVGRIDEGRAYYPSFELDSDFRVRDVERAVSLEMLRRCSIRVDAQKPSHERHVCPPCWLEVPGLVTTPSLTSRGGGKRNRRVLSVTDDAGMVELDNEIVGKRSLSSEQADAVKRWIGKQVRQGLLPTPYKDVMFEGFVCDSYRNRKHLAFVKLQAQYCANIGREHESNTVYLEFDGVTQMCVQKCFCRCDTTEGRRFRAPTGRVLKCSEYRSVPISATTVQAALFGGHKLAAVDAAIPMM